VSLRYHREFSFSNNNIFFFLARGSFLPHIDFGKKEKAFILGVIGMSAIQQTQTIEGQVRLVFIRARVLSTQ
jgi:hypothetical protein